MSEQNHDGDDGNLVVDRPPTEDREKLREPPKYGVIFLNDDFTPMEFVIAVLIQLFSKSQDEAEKIMLEVHEKGKALVASYPKDIAETKAYQVNAVAQREEHPFKADVQALH